MRLNFFSLTQLQAENALLLIQYQIRYYIDCEL